MIARHPVSVDHITTLGATPLEQIAIARELACEAISIIPAMPSLPEMGIADILADHALHREIVRACDGSGVRVHILEGLMLTPDSTAADWMPLLEMANAISTPAVLAVVLDTDRQRVAERFAEACELAAARGISVNIEFFRTGGATSLADTANLLERAGLPANGRIVIDFLHLIRGGENVAELAALAQNLVGALQICDGPMMATDEQYFQEMLWDRVLPGEGEFPVKALVHALPEDAILGIEVPMESRRSAGESALERARRAVQSTRALLL